MGCWFPEAQSQDPHPQNRRDAATGSQARIQVLSLAVENIIDVPGTVQYTDNFNRAGQRSVENDVPPEGKTLNPRRQLLSVASRAWLAGQQLNRLVGFVDESVRIRDPVISNVAPNLD